MLPELSYIILPITAVLVVLLALVFYKYIKLRETKENRDLEVKRRVYEDKLLDEIHKRYGYVLDTQKILDTVVDSISSITPYSVVSYVLIKGGKLNFRHHLYDNVSNGYLEDIKTLILENLETQFSSISLKNHIEEVVTGTFVDNSSYERPHAFIEVPLILNSDQIGFMLVSSKKPNTYTETLIQLVQNSIHKVFLDLGRLKKLIENEKSKLEMLVEKMNAGIVLIDQDFNVVLTNTAFYTMFNLTPKEKISIFEVVSKFGPEFSLDTVIARAFSDKKTSIYNDLTVLNKVYDVAVVPIDGKVEKGGVGIVITDKTQEHTFDKLKEDFTYMLVHELRSPLTIIMDSADLLITRKDQLSVEQFENLLAQVKTSSKNLIDIVNDLLDTAKIEAGKLELRKSLVDINALVSEEVSSFKHLAQNKGISISVDIDDRIELYLLDSEKMKQVMNNLISNAVKFTEKGEVKIVTTLLDHEVKIEVVDTGSGISVEDKRKLFDKYSQVSKVPDPKNKGTGLGLVIAKGIIEAHKGKIWVEDNLPHGTIFAFTIPVK